MPPPRIQNAAPRVGAAYANRDGCRSLLCGRKGFPGVLLLLAPRTAKSVLPIPIPPTNIPPTKTASTNNGLANTGPAEKAKFGSWGEQRLSCVDDDASGRRWGARPRAFQDWYAGLGLQRRQIPAHRFQRTGSSVVGFYWRRWFHSRKALVALRGARAGVSSRRSRLSP